MPHMCTDTRLSLGLLQREVHRHSPDTKATFSFRMGRTSEAFKPSFRKEPVGQQNRRNQGKRGQMAASLGPTFSLPTTSQARKLCLVQALQPCPVEQERVHNGKSTSTCCQATRKTKDKASLVPFRENTVHVAPHHMYAHKIPCPGANINSPAAVNLKMRAF